LAPRPVLHVIIRGLGACYYRVHNIREHIEGRFTAADLHDLVMTPLAKRTLCQRFFSPRFSIMSSWRKPHTSKSLMRRSPGSTSSACLYTFAYFAGVAPYLPLHIIIIQLRNTCIDSIIIVILSYVITTCSCKPPRASNHPIRDDLSGAIIEHDAQVSHARTRICLRCPCGVRGRSHCRAGLPQRDGWTQLSP
jgi:hypothetical protein